MFLLPAAITAGFVTFLFFSSTSLSSSLSHLLLPLLLLFVFCPPVLSFDKFILSLVVIDLLLLSYFVIVRADTLSLSKLL